MNRRFLQYYSFSSKKMINSKAISQILAESFRLFFPKKQLSFEEKVRASIGEFESIESGFSSMSQIIHFENEILNLWSECFGDNFDRQSIKFEGRNTPIIYILLKQGGKSIVIAAAILYTYKDYNLLSTFATKPEFQGLGFGKVLTKSVADCNNAVGNNPIYLCCKKNTFGFYAKTLNAIDTANLKLPADLKETVSAITSDELLLKVVT